MAGDLLRPFDVDAAQAAKPVFAVREKSEKAIGALPPSLQALAKTNNFCGEAGVILANDDGVLLGVGDESDPFIAAVIAEKGTEGDYFLRRSSALAPQKAAFGFLLGAYRFDRYKSKSTRRRG